MAVTSFGKPGEPIGDDGAPKNGDGIAGQAR
jgi:hypothetical protein